ncbi:MAG: hypothetical protein L3J41_10420 [Melioribacteraceae bacterium]|nr:hypothetical protein [Melioribacteraceae bacterium]
MLKSNYIKVIIQDLKIMGTPIEHYNISAAADNRKIAASQRHANRNLKPTHICGFIKNHFRL